MNTLLTLPSRGLNDLVERMRLDWIAQTTQRCFDDPAYFPTAIDVKRNPPPTAADALSILDNTRVLH